MKMSRLLIIFLIPALFFIISLFTIKDYGISWDEPIHFYRGQAYLHLFTTGKSNYADMPVVKEHQRARVDQKSLNEKLKSVQEFRRSYFQDQQLTADFWYIHDGGHPPLNGIMAAATNKIFYQKLGLLGDLESHHLFNILVSTLLVLIVVIFAYQTLGLGAALVSGITLTTYPLFLAESHFNIKDPAESLFITLTIWAFWMSLQKRSWKWLLGAVISFGFGLSTKFNILFLPFIISPYLLIRYWPVSLVKMTKISRVYMFTLLLAPFIIIAIFWGSWPYLWTNPITHFLEVVGYYHDIGVDRGTQPSILTKGGFNLYPIIWIITTTPPVVLILTLIGLIASFWYGKKEKVIYLFVVWLLFTIGRVTVPGTAIYGGVRQIMEYIPAMALFSGLGAKVLWDLGTKRFGKIAGYLLIVAVISGFIYHTSVLIKLHPNENVYFNSLIGGLSGAKERNIPYWGNSFGNAYWQAIQWLNENGEENAKLALIQGTGLNVPQIMLRPDIQYWNNYWSGVKKEGEYLMELTHNDPVKIYPYAWDYSEIFLEPVYEVKVDGVAIAKLWKNDLAHTREGFKFEVPYTGNITTTIKEKTLMVTFDEKQKLSRIIFGFDSGNNCSLPKGKIDTSIDGSQWRSEPEALPSNQISPIDGLDNGKATFFFPAREAKFLRVILDTSDSCLLQNPTIAVYILQ
jgi:hypothetical protein